MSDHPSYPPIPYQPVYPGGPAQFDWCKAYGYPPGGPAPRPGILTAVGVISIIVAGIGLLGSGFTALVGLGLFQMARMTTTMSTSSSSAFNQPVQGMAANPAMATPGGVQPTLTQPPAAAQAPTGRGMGPADRDTVRMALGSIEEMTDGQKQQLDAILARQGLDFFPEAGATPSNLTRADVTAAVKGHGTLPSPDPKEEDPVYFNTALGHLELHDDRGVFRFTDPTEPAVRTSAAAEEAAAPPPLTPAPTPGPANADAPAPGPTDPFADPAATQPATAPALKLSGTALSPAQISTVIQKVQAASGNKMNPAQIAGLSAALAKSDQQLVTPGSLWSPVSMAMPQSDGSILLKMNGGYYEIDAQGSIPDQAAGGGMPKIQMNPMPIALVIAESLASLALAIFLLLSGIFLLRESPRGRRMHQIFALIKIPLAVIAIAGFSWLMADLGGNMRRIPGSSGPSGGFVTFGIVLAAAGLIYPIALLITMQTKVVRDYYRTMSTSVWDV